MYQDSIDVTKLAAGRALRYANFLLDLMFCGIAFFLIKLIPGLLYAAFEIDGMLIWVSEMTKGGWIFLAVLFSVVYYVVMESLFQRTFGKMITGTIVVTEDGEKPAVAAVILRTFCRMIPFEPLSLFGESRRCWHDSLVNMYVIDVSQYKYIAQSKKPYQRMGSEKPY